MNETCCYCGEPTVYPHREPGIDAERGYHEYCQPTYGPTRFWRARAAEREAIEAAHDAAMAEAERIDWRRRAVLLHRLIGDLRFHNGRLRMERDASETRADAAEAALKQGVRELQGPRFEALQRAATVWEQRALAAETQLAAAREDGARSILAFSHTAPACYLSDDDAVLAAWRTAQPPGVGAEHRGFASPPGETEAR